MMKRVLHYALPTVQKSLSHPNVSDECAQSLFHIMRALLSLDMSALRLLDSSGKFPSGLLEGSTAALGAYDECLSTVLRTSEGQPLYRGKYCNMYIKPIRSAVMDRLLGQLTRHAAVKNRFNVTSIYEALKKGRIHGLRFGLCAPSTCTSKELELILSPLTELVSATVLITSCRTEEPITLNPAHVVYIFIFTVLLLMLAMGTSVDVLIRYKSKSKPGLDACRECKFFLFCFPPPPFVTANVIVTCQCTCIDAESDVPRDIKRDVHAEWDSATKSPQSIVPCFFFFSFFLNTALLFKVPLCFSAISNTESLLKAVDDDRKQLKCINGLRFFSAAWVILGHTYSVLDPHILGRALGIFEMTHQLLFCIIANAYPSVETFFVISGFLLVYQLYPKFKDTKKKIRLLLVAEIRRYVRITTPMMLLLGLIFLYPLVVHGPAADEWLPIKIGNCYRNWMAMPLHYNNWLTHADICSGHLWYLACDMQIFTVVLVLCMILAQSPRAGTCIMVLVALLCNGAIAYLTYVMQIGPSRVSSGGDVNKMMKALDLIHQRPFPHVASYIMGALTGFAILKRGQAQISKVTCVVLWLSATVCCLYGVFGAFKWQMGNPPVGADVIFYNGIHRSAFAFGICWVIYACITGHARLVNRLLSWNALLLLGRLTFSVYLVHFFVIVTSVAMTRERIYISHWFLVRSFFGNMVLSYIFGYLFYLTCEKPFVNLENIVFGRRDANKAHITKTAG
ncbi:O-acyltransferase like protein-like [Ornithodoros turicata]|uniref:O-acyltransferase like protein-like n=1 Tax=Ornithodoros turicata TaxID=34597 RepID=UPI003139B92D